MTQEEIRKAGKRLQDLMEETEEDEKLKTAAILATELVAQVAEININLKEFMFESKAGSVIARMRELLTRSDITAEKRAEVEAAIEQLEEAQLGGEQKSPGDAEQV